MVDIPNKPEYSHGSTGVQPASSIDYSNGDPLDAENLDYFLNVEFTKLSAIIDYLEAIDPDEDGKVTNAEQADQANTAGLYKGNDIDSDGDGKVDNADSADDADQLGGTAATDYALETQLPDPNVTSVNNTSGNLSLGISMDGVSSDSRSKSDSATGVGSFSVSDTATVSLQPEQTLVIDRLSASGDVQRSIIRDDETSTITFEVRINGTTVLTFSDTNNFAAADEGGHQFSVDKNTRQDITVPAGATVEWYLLAEIETTDSDTNDYDITIDGTIEGITLGASVS